MTYVLVGLAGFAAGVVAGILLRDAFEILSNGKGYLVDSSRSLARRATRSRTFGISLVAAALVANLLVGFLQITTRAEVAEQSRELAALSACQERYNRAQGQTLTGRDESASSITAAEIALWSDYLATFELALEADNAGDAARLEELQVRFADRIRAYRDELREINATRTRNPYPDPDLCRRLVP